jgi:hypothetical protein
MMARKITTMALIAGIVLGAAATEGFNVYRQSQDSYRRSHDSQSFQQRVHCKAVADAYVKEKSTDLKDNPPNAVVLTLDKVDYSPARNSCVAEVDTTRFFIGGGSENKSVEDLLSGETLFSLPCNKDCVEMFLKKRWIDPAFDYVMNNADEPAALEKAYVQMQSELAPKATAPASSVTEPNDWQTVPVTEYDAQGKPIASPQSPGTGKQYYDPDTGKPIQAPASQHKSAHHPSP